MITHKTTLGAPLTAEEHDDILLEFLTAKAWMNAVNEHDLPPEKFLELGRMLVESGFRLRDAVNRAFTAANARGTKTPLKGLLKPMKPRPRPERPSADVEILDLGRVSPEELHEVISNFLGERTK